MLHECRSDSLSSVNPDTATTSVRVCMCVLWKQIIIPHTILQTHHSYTDNQEATADWQPPNTTANGYLWESKQEAELRRTVTTNSEILEAFI